MLTLVTVIIVALCPFPSRGQSFSAVTYLSGATAGTPSNGSGTVVLLLNYQDTSLAISSAFAGLQGTTTMAHIHCCTAAPGVGTAGPATPLPSLPMFPLGVQSGTYYARLNMALASSFSGEFLGMNGNDPATAWFALFNGIAAGLAYWNIQTTSYPAGEIAGFFPANTDVPSTSPVTISPSPVPSPASPSPSPSPVSASPSVSNFPSSSPMPTPSLSPIESPSPAATLSPSPSPSPSLSPFSCANASPSPSPAPSTTPIPSPTPGPSVSPSPNPSSSPSPDPSPSPLQSVSPSPSASPILGPDSTTNSVPNPSPSPIPDPPVDCSACPSWCFASPRASPSPSPTPAPSPSPSPLCGCNPLGPLDPWAFQLVALGPVGSPGNSVVAYFGGAVLLSAPSVVDFQNINGDVIGNTLGTALAAAADVTFSGTSSSAMNLEVEGNLTNNGYWKGNVYVGGALVNNGVIQGNALSGSGCTGSCGPPQVLGTNMMGMHDPAVSVLNVQLYFSCLSLSVASLVPTVNFVSCSPTVAPTTCALAVSSSRNIANMYFSGITSIGIVGGDATTVLFLNVLDRGSVTYPTIWTFTSIKPSAVIVNVLYATTLSGSIFQTPVIAQLATLTSTTTNVTAHSTMVVNSLAADITYYFAPTPTSLNTNAHACYQS